MGSVNGKGFLGLLAVAWIAWGFVALGLLIGGAR